MKLTRRDLFKVSGAAVVVAVAPVDRALPQIKTRVESDFMLGLLSHHDRELVARGYQRKTLRVEQDEDGIVARLDDRVFLCSDLSWYITAVAVYMRNFPRPILIPRRDWAPIIVTMGNTLTVSFQDDVVMRINS